MKFYICPEVPDEGYIEAKDINEARDILNCDECFDYLESDCTPKQISLVYESLVNENAELRREMKQCIKELISAIDNSTLCKECCDKGCACSDCPWFKAKSRAFELLKEAEE